MKVDAHRFLEVFRLGARQAGAIARHLQGKVPAERKSVDPGATSPESRALTAVDLAAQEVFLHLLHEGLPGVAVDAEERTDAVHLFPPPDPSRPLVVLDPIDGTHNYASGSDDYAVMAALLEEGRYRVAVVHFPVEGSLYWAVRGDGCFREVPGRPPERVRIGPLPDRLLVTPWVPERLREALGAHAAEVRLSRCSAVDASAPAIGRARASVAHPRADRRRAIGFLLTLEAGGTVLFGDRVWAGEDPRTLPADEASIAAQGPALARAIQETMAPEAARG